MKGIVFTEFLDMVESKFGLDTVDQMIDNANLPRDATYTTVGTYDAHELVAMVVALHKISGIEVDDLVVTYGRHLFGILIQKFPHTVSGYSFTLDFLETIEPVIHVEVRKLYSDAELPIIETTRTDKATMILSYRSRRGLYRFAQGLIEGAAAYFNETLDIRIDDQSAGRGTDVLFHLALR